MPAWEDCYTGSIEAILAAEYDKDSDDNNQVADIGLSVVYLPLLVLVLLLVDTEDKGSLHHYLINKSICFGAECILSTINKQMDYQFRSGNGLGWDDVDGVLGGVGGVYLFSSLGDYSFNDKLLQTDWSED